MGQLENPNRVIVCAPGNVRTGGPEALHQFAHSINLTKTVPAEMFYLGDVDPATIAHYTAKYSVSRCETTTEPKSVVVIPEYVDPKSITIHSSSTLYVWWLSANRTYPLHCYLGCRHLFQSQHARRTLGLCGMVGEMLTDYIAHQVLPDATTATAKRNLIAYNGAKSALMGSRLLLENPSLQLMPIRAMSADEVVNLLHQAKIYLDFGPHPGKDRLPREAALASCIIFTNTRGSAGNPEDVPIPATYKIVDECPHDAAKRIHAALNEYELRQGDFLSYRESIMQQQTQFNSEVASFIDTASRFEPKTSVNLDQIAGLDKLLLEQKDEFLHLEQRANAFALEVEKLLSGNGNAIRIKNDMRKLYNRFRKLVQ